MRFTAGRRLDDRRRLSGARAGRWLAFLSFGTVEQVGQCLAACDFGDSLFKLVADGFDVGRPRRSAIGAGVAALPDDIEYVGDLHEGVWGELGNRRVVIDIYRRNLQRAFIDRVDQELNPSAAQLQREEAQSAFNARPPRWGNDVRAMLKSELRRIDREAAQAQGRAGDDMTRVHLADVRSEIERILKAGE